MPFRRFAKLLLTAVSAAALLAQTAAPDRDPRLPEAAKLIQQGSLNRAVTLLNGVVQARPDDAEAHLLLGSALSMVPRRNEAVEALLRALELRPNHAPGYTAAEWRFRVWENRTQRFRSSSGPSNSTPNWETPT